MSYEITIERGMRGVFSEEISIFAHFSRSIVLKVPTLKVFSSMVVMNITSLQTSLWVYEIKTEEEKAVYAGVEAEGSAWFGARQCH